MGSFDDFYSSLPVDPSVRGDQFEKIFVPWFLKTAQIWKSQIKQLWLWNDYPFKWGRDCGIDLVYRDHSGKDWAIQAKCVHPDREITKAEIDSFWSESSDRRIHGRLLIATTDRIGRNADQLIKRSEKQIVLFLLDNFRKSEIDFPSSLQTLQKGKPKDQRKPEPHQKIAIRNVVSGLSNAARGQLIMACGTGKTLTSLWIKEKIQSEQTLVLVPSLSLLSQTLREWTATASSPFKWLCVCSDATVANQDDDEWITHTSDIGAPVTGDVKEIKSFLRTEGSKVIFSTYQSSPLIAEAQKERKIPAFNLVLADEAHRCSGKVSEAFGCVLDSKQIRTDKLLFMTATPRILSRQIKTVAEGRDIEVVSMDDPTVFGEVLHQLKFSQAIEEGLLSDYRVEIVVVDDPLIQGQIQNRDLLRTSNGVELDAETLAAHVALAKTTKKYGLRRVISFHGRVAGAKRFAADHTDVLSWLRKADRPSGTTTADYVSGDMSSGDRNTKLNRLRHLEPDERGILSNARCLSEGVDVPSLDGVAFIDPRKSQVDIVQAVGRVIRNSKSDGKTHGTIIIPVFIDDGENEQKALESSRFKPIWDVVNALKSHDDDLAQELDQLRISLGKRGVIGSGGLQKIVFDLPKHCSQSFADGLRTRLVEQTTSSWMFSYGLLLEFVKQNGSASVPQRFKTKDGFALGAWVCRQRNNKDSLSTERRSLLESCKDWTWDALTDQWSEAFEHLQEYVKKNGSARVPQGFKTKDGFTLGAWVSHQRNNKDSLSAERRSLLESCKDWSWDPLTDQWNEAFEQLKEFVKTNGSARVPATFKTKDGFRLGQWVGTQRGTKNSLRVEQRNLLESCRGWSWDVHTDKWDKGFAHLQEFVKTTGSARVPTMFTTKDGFRLGTWISVQRSNKDSLSAEKRNLLEACQGWTWDPITDQWNEAFEKLNQYVKTNGSARVPQGFKTKDGFTLGAWVSHQRNNKDSLSAEKRNLLEACQGWTWDPITDQWNEAFEKLNQYVKTNGSARVPQGFKTKDGFTLGTWVSNQRSNKESLSAEKRNLLESSCKDWTWDPYTEQWNEGFQQLKQYVKNNGSARVPVTFKTKDGFALGIWVRNQRANKDSLSAEKRNLLESSCKDWTWCVHTDKWAEGFEHLKKYVKTNGSARVPDGFKTKDGFCLGAWVCRQRNNKDSLSNERRSLLESLNGWTWGVIK